MTEIILTFPAVKRATLSCVWFETGNPTRPLACKWIVAGPAITAVAPKNVSRPIAGRLCA